MKMSNLLENKPFSEIKTLVKKKLEKAKKDLKEIMPISYDHELEEINEYFRNI